MVQDAGDVRGYDAREAVAKLKEVHAKQDPTYLQGDRERSAKDLLRALSTALSGAGYAPTPLDDGATLSMVNHRGGRVGIRASGQGIAVTHSSGPAKDTPLSDPDIKYDYIRGRWYGSKADMNAVTAVAERVVEALDKATK
jgi:hypothetical protein